MNQAITLKAALDQAKYAVKLADRFANRVVQLETRIAQLEGRPFVPSLVLDHEADEAADVEIATLRDPRPLAEQQASWDKMRAMLNSWRNAPEVTT